LEKGIDFRNKGGEFFNRFESKKLKKLRREDLEE